MNKLDWHGLKVDPWQDTIDARDIAKRIEEIEFDHMVDGEFDVSTWEPDEAHEYRVLTELLNELPDNAARYGMTMIRESYFRDHIREEYGEIGPELYELRSRSGNATWDMELTRVPWDELMSRRPFSCIDWDAVAEECRSDYTSVEFEGTTYYYQEP